MSFKKSVKLTIIAHFIFWGMWNYIQCEIYLFFFCLAIHGQWRLSSSQMRRLNSRKCICITTSQVRCRRTQSIFYFTSSVSKGTRIMFYFIINVWWDIIKPLVKKTNKQKNHKHFSVKCLFAPKVLKSATKALDIPGMEFSLNAQK